MYQTFLATSSTFDPANHLRVDYIGNSGIRQATLSKNSERSRVWTFAGVIDSARHPGLFEENAIRHDYLRQRIVSANSVWEQSADAWEIVSYAIQKEWPLAALAPGVLSSLVATRGCLTLTPPKKNHRTRRA
jgi:hypothetical protein